MIIMTDPKLAPANNPSGPGVIPRDYVGHEGFPVCFGSEESQ